MVGLDNKCFTVNTFQNNLQGAMKNGVYHQISCVGVKIGSLGYDRISYIYGANGIVVVWSVFGLFGEVI